MPELDAADTLRKPTLKITEENQPARQSTGAAAAVAAQANPLTQDEIEEEERLKREKQKKKNFADPPKQQPGFPMAQKYNFL